MSIPRSFVEQLLQQCDLEELVGRYALVKRAGRNLKCLCPFHREKTPSFVIYPENQSFYCFGCGVGGDAISFVMKAENLDYPDAIRFLAQMQGMTVPEEGQDDQALRLRNRVLEINRLAARYFFDNLSKPEGRPGLEYLKSRQLRPGTIRHFGLGYALPGWDNLKNYLLNRGYTEQELVAADVVKRGKKGGLYDSFRNRVMFPIIDIRGNVIAFGGRVLDDSKPKYLNTNDTVVYKKSRNLFAFGFAKAAGKRKLILTEGYMDTIAVHAAGFENAVATCGTALTAEQARMMAGIADEIIIAYDSDGPGQTATRRAMNILSQAGLTSRVLKMEGAKDPDEYIKKFGAARFGVLLEQSENVMDYQLEELLRQYDITTSNGKIEYLRRSAALLAEVERQDEREIYLNRIAKQLDLGVDTVRSSVEAARNNRSRRQQQQLFRKVAGSQAVNRDPVNPEKARYPKQVRAEEEIIAYLMEFPAEIPKTEEKLPPEYFVSAFNRRVYQRLLEGYHQGETIGLGLFHQTFDSEQCSSIARMMAQGKQLTLSQEQLEGCIQTLREYRDRLSGEDIRQLTARQLEQLRREKAQKRR